jgi:NAD(P)H dehydrogenase (quinone)
MILVTGAAGKTGRAVVRALVNEGISVRAFIHREDHREIIKEAGASEIMVGDLLNADDLIKAVNGARALYHIPPNIHPGEVEIGELVINAAMGAALDHFVYHSVLHPQIEAMPHHWLKLKVEERLLESGLPFTILQPTAYMQNITSTLSDIIQEGVYQIPYPVDTRTCLVDLEDVARVAALVVSDQNHQGAIYELVGTEALSQRKICRILGEGLNKPIMAKQIPVDQWKSGAREAGLNTYKIDTLVKMFHHYQQFGFTASTRVLSWLLGRQPTSLEQCLEREMAALRNKQGMEG